MSGVVQDQFELAIGENLPGRLPVDVDADRLHGNICATTLCREPD
jgi:hypothetical protein